MARRVELPIAGVEVFNASEVEEKAVEWIWRNRIPRAKLTLFVGHPGLGKSFELIDTAARLSNGEAWPDGTPNGTVGRTLIFSAEDGMADTIIARLKAQKADLTKITICKRVRTIDESGEIVRRGFNLLCDLPELEGLLDSYPDTQLVIIDPVSAYISGRNGVTHQNAEMRSEVLDPLSELAERRGVAIAAVSHFNKGSGNGLERVSGSIAFPAAARVVWGFVRSPEDETKTLMLFGKSNVGPRVSGLAFHIEEIDGRATLTWEAGEVHQRLDEVLREERNEKGPAKVKQAKDLIRQLLTDGKELPSDELDKRGAEHGISASTVWRARREIGCRARRKGFSGPWYVSLPIEHEASATD
jgi:hypothetical protein